MTPWKIHGSELTNCNCTYGCPCQFNARPTKGSCEAALSFHVDTGHYGDVKLDGLSMAMVVKWPGAIHEGNGHMQIIIDERADAAQRVALEKIMHGEDTADMATMWWVFSMMSPKKEETLYKKISYASDIAGRTGHVTVEDVFKLDAEPIKNPVTGNPHRVRIDMIGGFGYRVAEMGSGSVKTSGKIDLPSNTGTYAQFNEIHLGNNGIIEAAA